MRVRLEVDKARAHNWNSQLQESLRGPRPVGVAIREPAPAAVAPQSVRRGPRR